MALARPIDTPLQTAHPEFVLFPSPLALRLRLSLPRSFRACAKLQGSLGTARLLQVIRTCSIVIGTGKSHDIYTTRRDRNRGL